MTIHKEFKTAGKTPGLQVWRLEKMDLSPICPEFHGSFYTGDAYILLKTISVSPPAYNIHSWTGHEATQDERGAAAIFMIQLDDCLKETPRQFTEFQGNESITFREYFKSGLKYMKGGVASGFKHVVTNEQNVKRILHVKGRHTPRATEVDLSWSSFNSGDCFIIDLGKKIYHWSGKDCNPYERLKATEVAIDIRDNERAGKSDILMIDEGCEPNEIISLLGPKPELPPASMDDYVADTNNLKTASLYLISNATGSMKTTLVNDKNPFKQDVLSQSECYILDNGVNVFVWKGKDADQEERKAALKVANEFVKEKNYTSNTQVCIMPAGSETALFKQFFLNWLDKYETTGPSEPYIASKIARVEKVPFDASVLHTNKVMAAQHGMVDDGSGKVQIWRVEGDDKKPVDPNTYGQFFGGDCYLVLYTYNENGKEKHIIYNWQGQYCSQWEKGASAILTIALDNLLGRTTTQVRCTQGHEPPHLVSLFKDKPLVIYLGGTSRKDGDSKPGSIRLFHIRQSSTKATRAVEVQPIASSLNSNDVFVLKSSDSLWQWKGKGATTEEIARAKDVASLLGGSATEVEETNEPAGFWEALGGKMEYQTSVTLQKSVKPPRLFRCSNKTGTLIAEEVPGDLIQMNLAADDIMLLDTWEQIFLWVGKDANEAERAGSDKIAGDYVDLDPAGRQTTPITTIKQGQEPLSFTGWFHAWDPTLWEINLMKYMEAKINKQ